MQLYDDNTSQEGQGPYIIRKIQRATYDVSRLLWLARNQSLHGETTQDLARIRSSEEAEFTELHQHPELISAGDRHYCKQ
jgi:hypothetical protein